MTRQDRMFNICYEAAEKSDMYFKHGSAIVKGGTILSTGYNHSRSRFDNSNYCSMHSEMHALWCFKEGFYEIP
jgi:deoxycytidylate deaminase